MKLSIFEFFTNCLWWQLLWMLVSFLLGWLLARRFFSGDSGNCCDELSHWKQKYLDLESKYNSLLNSNAAYKPINSIPENLNLGLSAGSSIYDRLESSNLQIIEGIGPKMEELLHQSGINTWKDLAGKTPHELRLLLDQTDGNRYKIIDPSTWSDQAQLAVNGKFQELIALQKTLDTGKTDAINETDSKLEKIMIKLGIFKKWKQDDLKAIEGIGPKIEALFIQAGIKTWDDLADAKVEKLKEILHAAGDKYRLADPTTWPAQAELAAEGRWHELQIYQDQLNGGK